MDMAKFLSKPGKSAEQQNTGRRSFMWKAGAALSAALAYAVPSISAHRDNEGNGVDAEVDRLSNRVGILEDEKAIHKLHQAYEAFLDDGRYEAVVDLFTEDGEVVFNGGVFKGRKDGIARLYCDCFSSGLTGKKIGPVPGFQADTEQQQETIKVADDRLFASAQFPYSIQVGAPLAPDSQLVKMARLHGEGIMKWCESGIYEASYAKDIKNGSWKIKRLEYRVLSSTDYRPGRRHAGPISVSLFAKTYPEDPAGPDRLIAPAQMLQKA
jgi:hypothetical protein